MNKKGNIWIIILVIVIAFLLGVLIYVTLKAAKQDYYQTHNLTKNETIVPQTQTNYTYIPIDNLTNLTRNEDGVVVLNMSEPKEDNTLKANPNNTVILNMSEETITFNKFLWVANWNLQIFGTKKADNETLMSFYVNKIKQYDIVFVQEIRDESGTAFPKLCAMLPDYNCKASSRAGSSVSKEQYGVIYKKILDMTEFKDYNPDLADKFNRPPIKTVIDNVTFWNIHTDPDNVPVEMDNLEALVSNETFTIILGDLNADCNYYDRAKELNFRFWNWLIWDTDDTTVAQTNCAYDRIITNQQKYIWSFDVDKNITKEYSDHYLVWVQVIR